MVGRVFKKQIVLVSESFSLDCSSCCCRFQEGLYLKKKSIYNNCSDFAMLVGFIRCVALASDSHLSSLSSCTSWFGVQNFH
jgi:hypothetical protein